MDRYIQFVLKRPAWTIAFFLVITIGLSLGIPNLKFDTSISKFLPETDPEYLYYNKVKAVYGDVDTFVILSISDDQIWHAGTFTEMDALLKDLEAYENYKENIEKGRLERLDWILSTADLPAAGVLDQFEDDQVFQRLIARKLHAAGIAPGFLNERDKRRLRDAVLTADKLKQQEMIDDIVSPLGIEDVTGEDDTLSTVKLIETNASGERRLPKSLEDFSVFRSKLMRNPVFEKGIYATNASGEITDFGYIIRFKEISDSDPIAREILEIVDTYQDRLHIVAQGQPLVYIWVNNYMQRDLAQLVPLVLLVAIIIFFFNFRSLLGVVLPTMTLMMATVWILGLMGHLGFEITTVGVSIPILMIAVGSSYGIHILNQYYTDLVAISRKGKFEGLRQSMNHISITVLLTGLTTIVAFLTLCTHQLSVIREWGLFCATGIVFAVWISASIIPAGLALAPGNAAAKRIRKEKDMRPHLIDRLVRLAIRVSTIHYKLTLFIVSIFLIICLIGLSRVKVETEILSYFKPDNPIRTSAVEISKKFGGRWGFNILLDSGAPDGVKDPKFLNTIADLREWLTSSGNGDLRIGRTDAFDDHINTMHMAMNNDDPAFYRIPETKTDILDYLELFSAEDVDSDGRADIFEPYVCSKFQTCNILARLSEGDGKLMGTSGLQHTFERIRAHLDQTLPAGYSYKITGHPAMVMKSADYIIFGQIQSLMLTFAIIWFVVLMLLRDVRAASLALIPLAIGVCINFGIMGWFGIDLDIATSLIAAITIGIGVDDTIHFLNTFRYHRNRGLNACAAIERTQEVAGKAIIFTSLALILGFSVLLLSTFRPLILFGLLMAVTMVSTTFGALVVLPAAIKLTGVQLAGAPAGQRLFSRSSFESLIGRSRKTGEIKPIEID